jgi:hypothetical protein
MASKLRTGEHGIGHRPGSDAVERQLLEGLEVGGGATATDVDANAADAGLYRRRNVVEGRVGLKTAITPLSVGHRACATREKIVPAS